MADKHAIATKTSEELEHIRNCIHQHIRNATNNMFPLVDLLNKIDEQPMKKDLEEEPADKHAIAIKTSEELIRQYTIKATNNIISLVDLLNKIDEQLKEEDPEEEPEISEETSEEDP